MANKKVAVIADDDKDTLRQLMCTLEEDGFEVMLALDNHHALQLIKNRKPVIIVAEIGKTNYDGLKLWEAYIKESNWLHDFKMVILTSNKDEKYEVSCIEAGIHDFLLKPFRKNAFQKRMSVYFKKDALAQKADSTNYRIGDLYFNLPKKVVYRIADENKINIQSKTFDILYLMASNANVILSREQIKEAVWGVSKNVTHRTIDVHILKIRQMLGEKYVSTVKGVGYIFINKP